MKIVPSTYLLKRIDSLQPSDQFCHSSQCSSRILHSFFSLFQLFSLSPSRALRHVILSTNSFNSAIQHFFDVATLSSIHLLKHIQRRNSAQARAPADLVAHHSQDIQETHAWRRTTMYLELHARIVRSSSICQVVLHLLSPILFCQCGHLSFCSLRIVSRPRQIRLHVDPPSAPRSWVPWAHLLHLAQLELSSSLSVPLSRRLCLCMRSSLP